MAEDHEKEKDYLDSDEVEALLSEPAAQEQGGEEQSDQSESVVALDAADFDEQPPSGEAAAAAEPAAAEPDEAEPADEEAADEEARLEPEKQPGEKKPMDPVFKGTLSLAAVALVGAVPAAWLSYLLVASLIGGFENMSGMFKGLSIFTLAVSAFVAVLPIGIVVFGPKSEEELLAEEEKREPEEESAPAAELPTEDVPDEEPERAAAGEELDVESSGEIAAMQAEEDIYVTDDEDLFDEEDVDQPPPKG